MLRTLAIGVVACGLLMGAAAALRGGGLQPPVITTPPPTGQPAPALESLAWLLGDWVSGDKVKLNEVWSSPQGDAMTGIARVTVNDKLVSVRAVAIKREEEKIVLRWRELSPTLEARKPGDDRVLVFPLAASGDGTLSFENPQEDHPRRVNFQRLGPDSLKIEFIGMHEGALHTQPYEYTRRQGQ